MSIKDYFNIALTNMFRNKKNRFYIVVMVLCSLVAVTIVFLGYNLLNILNNDMKNQIDLRTFNIDPKTTPEILGNPNKEERNSVISKLREAAIKELLTIDHVQLVTKSEYSEFYADTSDFKLEGNVTFLYATEKSLPQIVAGRSFKDGESGVAICPVNFFPNPTNPDDLGVLGIPTVNKKDLIYGKELLGKKFTATYDEYKLEGSMPEIVGTHSKKIEIIGLYSNAGSMSSNDACYVPGEDIVEMCHNANFVCASDQEHIDITVVVDKIENVDYFATSAVALGFSPYPEPIVKYDSTLVKTIEIALVILISLVLGTVSIITLSYIKKKVLNESKTIGILRSCGYTKKTIKKIYLLENIFTNSLSYLIALIIFFTAYIILKNQYIIGLTYRGIYIKMNIYVIIYSFSIIVLFSVLIAYMRFNKKLKSDIVLLVGSGE
ncbi:MAG: ABC transporter permease [Bacilli bacterium]|nr:ABC transporter permease [Bacilli bacterium]